MFKHVLVATDFGPSSQRAKELAVEIAKRFDATLTLVHVYEIPSYVYAGVPYTPADLITPIREGSREALGQELAEVQKTLPKAAAILRTGHAADEVLAVAKETKADLIVLGTHGRRGIPRALLGSVAEKIVRTAQAPVLTVHGG